MASSTPRRVPVTHWSAARTLRLTWCRCRDRLGVRLDRPVVAVHPSRPSGRVWTPPRPSGVGCDERAAGRRQPVRAGVGIPLRGARAVAGGRASRRPGLVPRASPLLPDRSLAWNTHCETSVLTRGVGGPRVSRYVLAGRTRFSEQRPRPDFCGGPMLSSLSGLVGGLRHPDAGCRSAACPSAFWPGSGEGMFPGTSQWSTWEMPRSSGRLALSTTAPRARRTGCCPLHGLRLVAAYLPNWVGTPGSVRPRAGVTGGSLCLARSRRTRLPLQSGWQVVSDCGRGERLLSLTWVCSRRVPTYPIGLAGRLVPTGLRDTDDSRR